MTSPPAVTVIIPTYNSSGTLRLALETVRRQSYENFEVWVVGDGCTDDSPSVVAAFEDERFHWLNLPTNTGTPSKPRNEALGRAKGQYVAYLGHDDLWFPWHLERLVGCLERSGSDFVCSLGAALASDGSASPFRLPEKLRDLSEGYSPSNWLHRRELVETIGPWSEKVVVSNDLDFLSRVFKHGASRAICEELTALKFPAVYWRMYSLSVELPQARYVEAMKADAEALRDELVRKIAGRAPCDGVTAGRRGLPAKLLGHVRYFLRLHAYRYWPLNRLSRWRYRRRAGLP